MLSSLVSTKLYIPPLRPDYVRRPRLVDALETGHRIGRRVTLVSAPAGYGKTSLLSEWQTRLAERQVPIAWLALEESDNEPQRFLRYLLAAVQTVFPRVGQSWIPQLDQAVPPPPLEVMAGLINEVAGLGSPLVLALDDYHLISNPAINEAIGFLVDRCPPNLHLVIASRHDPLLPLPRLRVRGQITEVRLKDLRFRLEEAAAFIGQGMGLSLQESDLAALQERTEGWAAGLQLAAISLSDRETATADFIRDFTGDDRHVLDYLLEEVLARQPASVQRFLLYTSLLEKFCLPLCEAILEGQPSETGGQPSEAGGRPEGAGEDCQAVLDSIDRSNLFLIPLDNRREWFRYHHLFRDALLHRLQRLEPKRLPDYHRRAAGWFDSHGYPTQAFDHALTAGDVMMAVDIAERWIDPLHIQGQFHLYRPWFQTIPPAVLLTRPELLFRKARMQLLVGDLIGSQQSLDDMDRCLEGKPDPFPRRAHLWVLAKTQRASIHSAKGELNETLRLIEEAHQWLPPDDPVLAARVSFYRGQVYLRCGDLANAEVGYREIFRTALVNKSFYSLFSGLVGLLLIAAYQGEARRGLRQAEDLFAEHQADLKDLPISGIGYGYMGELAFYLNRLEEAEAWLSDALDRFQRGGIQDDGPRFRLVLADVKVSLDKPGEADALLREVNSVITSEIGERRRLLLGALHSRVRLKQGLLDEPAQWAEQFVRLIDQPYCEALQDNTLAWAWLAQGKALEALHFLETRLERLDKNGIRLYQMENLALQALALQRLGSQTEALEKIQQALWLAEPAGYDRVIVGLGFEMAWLLARLKSALNPADRLQAYVTRLLSLVPEKDRAGTQVAVPQTAEKPTIGNQEWVEELSEREIEVLRLMARGLSNAQIAEAMVVAESTVKKHINHIFGKLDVSNRTQALIKARERNLL